MKINIKFKIKKLKIYYFYYKKTSNKKKNYLFINNFI
jgi:hypothetical protein